MSERIKAEILKVGTFDEDGNATGWSFDGHNRAVGIEFDTATGGQWFSGYTIEELREIASPPLPTSNPQPDPED